MSSLLRRCALAILILVVLVALAFPARRRLIFMRLKGDIEVSHGCSVFSPGIFSGEEAFVAMRGKVHELRRDGPIALFDTPIGTLWYRVGAWTLPAVVEENTSDEYHFRSTIKPGDVVLDVGANVGTDTRSALAAGAGLAVAIEPEPLTLECLRRNLAAEIQQKRVIVVPKGAWEREDVLSLHVDTADAGGSSFVWAKNGPTVQAPLTTIDRIVDDLHLSKVNLIKMDIEGAEKNALLGAANTIRRFHPRLALVLEHHVDDVDVLPAIVRRIWPGYHLELTPCVKTFNRTHPDTALMFP